MPVFPYTKVEKGKMPDPKGTRASQDPLMGMGMKGKKGMSGTERPGQKDFTMVQGPEYFQSAVTTGKQLATSPADAGTAERVQRRLFGTSTSKNGDFSQNTDAAAATAAQTSASLGKPSTTYEKASRPGPWSATTPKDRSGNPV